jgi:Tfp pilus assembly protein PilZ
MEDDRRSHHRHACLVEVQGMHGERFFCGRAHNLSASGAFVECDTEPARGEPIYLLFDVPPRLYRLVGHVVAGRANAPKGFAVSFETEAEKVKAVARALAGEAKEVMRRPVLRAHVRLPCQVRLQGATGEQVFECLALDISPVGAFLVTNERFPSGTFVTLRFDGSEETPRDAPAVVRWHREYHGPDRPAGLGVAFLREEQALHAAIRGEDKE